MRRKSLISLILGAMMAAAIPAASFAYDPSGPGQAYFGEPSGSFKISKPARGLSVATSGPKGGYIPIYSRGSDSIEFSLAKADAGYLDGETCRRKPARRGVQQRCDLRIKGWQTVEVEPDTESYLKFGGRWDHRAMTPGEYVLTARLDTPIEIPIRLRK